MYGRARFFNAAGREKSRHGLIHVVVVAAHLLAAAPAALGTNGALHFFLTAATAAVVVRLLAFGMSVTAHALGFAIATARRIVEKEHMFSPP